MQKSIKYRALSSTVIFLIGFMLVIFLPAWTVDFWQAWLYWCVFSAAVLFITIYFLKHDPVLIERRMHAGPTAEKERSQQIIQAFMTIVFILILVIPGLDHRFGWSNIPASVSIFANVFVMVGFYIVFLTFRENSFASAIIDTHQKQKVISSGPYAVIRHPMYAGACIFLLATPLSLGSYWGLVCVIPMIAGIIWRLFEEEKFLKQNLPGYAEYCRKVVYRLIPSVW